ncbi:hypothetical protein N4P33_16180 [Streptomyces sp. 15-116A]|uniref:hypothetical protein n=1 Tax=Streptomyces sp. 15-116A TaxID=2259035 RepID=UPI0021B31278|nr:hypothetical protein [Streptomyces sp. 15-116A]MCT7353696.1 hypothetical protein [Streptomyces sp. 15-116A]
MTKQRAALGFLAVAMSAGVALGTVSPAQAATFNKKCGGGPGNCVITKYHPKKGTVRVTVDNSGNGSMRYGWDIRHKGKIVCTGEIRENWKKPKTFTCKNMPKGNLKLTMPYRKSTSIALKW